MTLAKRITGLVVCADWTPGENVMTRRTSGAILSASGDSYGDLHLTFKWTRP